MTTTADTPPAPRAAPAATTTRTAHAVSPPLSASPTAGTDNRGNAPWYRRGWVLAVGAVLLALLSFGSGFIAGNAASLFDGPGDGPGMGFDGERGFPGDRPGEGGFPAPGDSTSSSSG